MKSVQQVTSLFFLRSDIIDRMNRVKRRTQSDQHPMLRLLRMAKESQRNDPRLVGLLSACRKGNVVKVRSLLKAGLDPNEIAPGDATLDTAVSAAVYARRPAVLRVLAAAGADLDAGHSYTPLVTAAGWRHLPLVLALIEGGANVNQADSSGTTPLRAAVLGGHSGAKGNPLPIVAALLEAGADPDLVPRRHNDYAAKMTPLRWAAYKATPPMVDLFLAAGAVEDWVDALRLCGAAWQGNLKEVRKLVARGVNINQQDSSQRTPLIVAAETGKQAVVAYLLKHCADPNLSEGARNQGQSALIAAAIYGRLNIVRMLVEAGAKMCVSKSRTIAQRARLRPP